MPHPAKLDLGAFSAAQLRETFTRQAQALKTNAIVLVGDASAFWFQDAADYINKASLLADKIGLVTTEPASGNGAWSVPKDFEPLIPTSRVFSRIASATAPSIAEVERALQNLQVSATAAATMVGEALQLSADRAQNSISNAGPRQDWLAPNQSLPHGLPTTAVGLGLLEDDARAIDGQL